MHGAFKKIVWTKPEQLVFYPFLNKWDYYSLKIYENKTLYANCNHIVPCIVRKSRNQEIRKKSQNLKELPGKRKSTTKTEMDKLGHMTKSQATKWNCRNTMNIRYGCAVQSVNELKQAFAHQNQNALKILKQTRLFVVELNQQPM